MWMVKHGVMETGRPFICLENDEATVSLITEADRSATTVLTPEEY